jgi:LytS/YehU family sensor histidine kinase
MGNARSIAISTFFTLIFSGLFTGISFAGMFYRQAVARARAVETMRAELAEAELRALRAQINPHFLFNTLNSIAALIRIDPAAAEATTTRLADVFRYTLRASDLSHARLADELHFVREYLEIERTRFGKRLRVVESIETELEDAEVPTLLLQPLVENAVRYVVSPREEGGEIRISARRAGATLELSVADDGPGIDAVSQSSGTGFGLHSVRERLRAAGPPHALDIRSAPDRGTEIVLTLPIRPSSASHPSPTQESRHEHA